MYAPNVIPPKEQRNFNTWLRQMYPLAVKAVKLFPVKDAAGKEVVVNGRKQYMNPLFLLAQSWIETGGYSGLVQRSYNVGSITATKNSSAYWDSRMRTRSQSSGLEFRVYRDFQMAWNDYARLLFSPMYNAWRYKTIEQYADGLSKSKYISEKNGDDRAAYRKGILASYARIVRELPNIGVTDLWDEIEKK